MSVRRILILVFALLMFSSRCANAREDDQRILFIGNSLTYVGNLPAVFEALATTNGKSVHADMIVRGGATLTNHVAEGAVGTAFASHSYSFVILQERGGDFMCGFGPQSCIDAKAALTRLVGLARKHGATPLLLGTYQRLPTASETIIAAEKKAAEGAGIEYVAVSGHLQTALTAGPDDGWFYSDGMHPGPNLVLMESLLLFRQVFGVVPQPSSLNVDACMFTPSQKFEQKAQSTWARTCPDTQFGYRYPVETVELINRVVRPSSK